MVTAGDFRNGMTFDMDGDVYQIIAFQHVKPGKGAAFVRTKIRNVISGAVVDKTFNPTDKFPTAYIERREMQYLYPVSYTHLLRKRRNATSYRSSVQSSCSISATGKNRFTILMSDG